MPNDKATGNNAGEINVASGDLSVRCETSFLNRMIAIGVATIATDSTNTHHVRSDKQKPAPPSTCQKIAPAMR